MDEHYDLHYAREWMSKGQKKGHSHTQPNLGNQLEEWTNVRNTKSQYTKQLRNFLKVSAITRHSKTTPTNMIQKDQRYQRSLQTNGSRS